LHSCVNQVIPYYRSQFSIKMFFIFLDSQDQKRYFLLLWIFLFFLFFKSFHKEIPWVNLIFFVLNQWLVKLNRSNEYRHLFTFKVVDLNMANLHVSFGCGLCHSSHSLYQITVFQVKLSYPHKKKLIRSVIYAWNRNSFEF
jgi:hypothetical protein